MSDVDDQIASSRAMLQRLAAPDGAPGRDRRRLQREVGRRLARVAAAVAAILVAVGIAGVVLNGIGIFGFLLMVVAIVGAVLFFGARPTERPVRVERLQQGDLKALPARAERWLAQQRAALPAPAARLADQIGARLETLSPQLARVGDDSPEAGEVRKLVGEQLPAFLADYARVPAPLRAGTRNGRSPDGELVAGLTVIEAEIAQLTERLAAADLDQLSTRGRYLKMRYKDGDEG